MTMTSFPEAPESAPGPESPRAHRPLSDYELTGEASRRAVEMGLTAAEWYHTEVPRKVMKELMARHDGPAIRDTIIWAVLHIAFAAGGIALWGTWWCVPFWIAYGVLYGSACALRWHECAHGPPSPPGGRTDVAPPLERF